MRRVAVIGSAGQLGSDLVRVLEQDPAWQVIPLSHREVEVASRASVDEALRKARPDVVINCAAFVRVDECESHPEEPFRVNALGARYVAETCAALDADCVYISTDYVFGGEKRTPYTEEDLPDPINVYGISKAAGEQMVRATLGRHYIVRSSGLFGVAGASGKGGNFIDTMLRLAREEREIRVVDDQRFSPTFTLALAQKIAWLVATGEYGAWHVTCQGDCTWYELACAVFQQLRMHPRLSPTTTEAFGARARRPAYSVLGHHRLQQAGAEDPPRWQDAVAQYLRAKGLSPV